MRLRLELFPLSLSLSLQSRLMSALRPTAVASGEPQRRGGRGLESGEDPVVIIAKQMSETAIAKSMFMSTNTSTLSTYMYVVCLCVVLLLSSITKKL